MMSAVESFNKRHAIADDESNKPVTSNYSPTKIDVQTKSDTLDSFVDYLTPPKKDAVSVYEKQSFKLNPKISLAPAPIIIAVEKDEEGPENRFSLLEGKYADAGF